MAGQTGGPARADRIAELQRQIEELQDTPDADLQRPEDPPEEKPRAQKRDRYARQRAEADAARTADFDSWRARRSVKTPSIVIGGRRFALPKQAPLMFTLERRRMDEGHEMSEQEVRKMTSMLFGREALDHFVDNGLDHEDLSVLLIWGGANVGATEERVDLDRAQAEFERLERDKRARAEGNGPNRAARRRNGKRGRGPRSSSTGRS